MKVALINGSPKGKKSASGWLLDYVAQNFENEIEVAEINFRNAAPPTEEQLKQLDEAEAWLFAFPLYVDGVPGHLLSTLITLEHAALTNPERRIYGICNCGFYEGEQNELALDVLKNWSAKCGYIWGCGFGIGGGGAILSFADMGKVGMMLMGKWTKALKGMALMIEECKRWDGGHVCGSIALPRAIYQHCAHSGWKKKIKAAGGAVEDLERRL